MERYQRSFRDATSPLTPLTPLLGNLFDFNIDASSGQASLSNAQLDPSHGFGNSPLALGIEALANIFQQERGYCLGSGPNHRRMSSTTSLELGEDKTPKPTCSRFKRIKSEAQSPMPEKSPDIVPHIRIDPPQRRRTNGGKNPKDYNNSDGACNVEQLSENSDFIRQQQKQLEYYKNHRKRHFDASKIRLSSPVAPKPLSPRLGAFLSSWGMNCLKSIFERQEIDLQTFCCLTPDDLHLLGIEDAGKQELVLKAIEMLKNKFQQEE